MKSLLGKVLSPSTYLLLIIFQILQYCCNAEAGTIVIDPVTQIANLSSSNYVTFSCRAIGFESKWFIRGATYSSGNYTKDGYEFSEVLEDEDDGQLLHDMYLKIHPTINNNETSVQCSANLEGVFLSETALLIVQGGPAAPVPVLRVINSSLLILEWDAPFTWPYTTIKHYSISVNGTSEDWNQSSLNSRSLDIRASDDHVECTVYSFVVQANNGLDYGKPGTITGGFPVAPRIQEVTIRDDITFNSDNSPNILLYIELPVVCGYQRVQHTVTGRDSNSVLLFQYGPITQLYSEGATVSLPVNTQLLNNVEVFNVIAEFNVIGVENSTFSNHYSAQKTITIMTPSSSEGLATEQVVLIAVVGGALALIAAVIIAVLLAVYAYRKKRTYHSGNNKPSPMVTNPIYEGQSVYETIDPNYRSISFTSSNSLPPPTPTSTRPMMESPYAHSQVDPNYADPQLHPLAFPPTPMEEAYTIMASASQLSKISDNGESDLDRKTSDVVRYAPEPSMMISEC